MEHQHIRMELARAVSDLRGQRSLAFLRGMARAATTCFGNHGEICPYDTANPQKEEFWAGHSHGIDVIRGLTVYRSESASSRSTHDQALEHPPVPPVAAHRASTPWELDEVEELIDLYHGGTRINDLAKAFFRTDNAIIWQLWSEAASSQGLLERMQENGHTRPLRRGDLRNAQDAFRWVCAFLRGATKLMLRTNQEVTLDALLSHAAGTLLNWPPREYKEDAQAIEYDAATWFFNHPERWAGREHW